MVEAHREELRAYATAYRKANREEILAKQRQRAARGKFVVKNGGGQRVGGGSGCAGLTAGNNNHGSISHRGGAICPPSTRLTSSPGWAWSFFSTDPPTTNRTGWNG